MVAIYCCVNGCESTGSFQYSKHSFPNPNKNLALFNYWVKACNNKRLEEMDSKKIYTNCRICKLHFIDEDFGRNNKLLPNVYPKKNLPICLDPFTSDMALTKNVEKPTSKIEPPCSSNIAHHDPIGVGPKSHQESNAVKRAVIERAEVSSRNKIESSSTLDAEPLASTSNDISLNLPYCHSPVSHFNPSSRVRLLKKIGNGSQKNLTPRKQIMYREICKLKKEVGNVQRAKLSLKQRLREAWKFNKSRKIHDIFEVNATVRGFIESQLENLNRNSRGRKFTENDKILALALYKQSGAAYRFLSAIFALPSKQTLSRFSNKIPIRPGFNDTIFKILDGKFTKKLDRMVVLMFDEMKLEAHLSYNATEDSVEGYENLGYKTTNEIANHTQVFMLRGIRRRWKQPVYYAFVNGANKSTEIAYVIEEIVKRCTAINLQVVATVCDQGSNNCKALKNLVHKTREDKLRKGMEMDQSEFYFEVENQIVYPIYDPPHLIKGLRNNLLEKDLKFTLNNVEMRGSWKDFVTAYKMDPYLGSLRMLHKITDAHVYPSHTQKMKVSLCTQALSRTSAVAMNTWAITGHIVEIDEDTLKMDGRAIETAKLFEFVDNLFDSFNGFGRSTKPLRSAVSSSSIHWQLWSDALCNLTRMKFVVVDKKRDRATPPSLSNFIVTTKNLMLLTRSLLNEGFKTVNTRCFNQDPLENLFAKVRQHGSRYVNPTPESFTPFLKSILINNFTTKQAAGSNCEEDNTSILAPLQTLLTEAEQVKPTYDVLLHPKLPNMKPRSAIERWALCYVLGYVSKKILPATGDCGICHKSIFATSGDEMEHPDNTLIKNKEFTINKRSLKYVNLKFKKKMTRCYFIIKEFLRNNFPRRGLIHNLLAHLSNIELTECQTHKVTKLILKKFIRINICNISKQLNNIMKRRHKTDHEECPEIIYQSSPICQERFQEIEIVQ